MGNPSIERKREGFSSQNAEGEKRNALTFAF